MKVLPVCCGVIRVSVRQKVSIFHPNQLATGNSLLNVILNLPRTRYHTNCLQDGDLRVSHKAWRHQLRENSLNSSDALVLSFPFSGRYPRSGWADWRPNPTHLKAQEVVLQFWRVIYTLKKTGQRKSNRPVWPAKPNMFTIWPFTETFAEPSPKTDLHWGSIAQVSSQPPPPALFFWSALFSTWSLIKNESLLIKKRMYQRITFSGAFPCKAD